MEMVEPLLAGVRRSHSPAASVKMGGDVLQGLGGRWWNAAAFEVFAAASLTSSSGSHKAFLAVGTGTQRNRTCNGMALNLMWWREKSGGGAMRTSGWNQASWTLAGSRLSLQLVSVGNAQV